MFTQHVFCIFAVLCSTNQIILEVQGGVPAAMATIRRIRPIRIPEVSKSTPIEGTRSRSESISSFSSSQSENSLSKHHTVDSDARPSTSTGKRGDNTDFKEVELHPIIAESKHVSFMKSVDFNDASTATHTRGNINPARDGVRARMRSAVLRFGAAVVAGTAAGAGVALIDQQFFRKSTTEIPTEESTMHVNVVQSTTTQVNEELNNLI